MFVNLIIFKEMKTILSILFVVILTTMGSCQKDGALSNNNNSSNVELKVSALDYLNAISNPSSETSDPFELGNIVINGNTVEITVSYPGGCAPHTFEIVWDGTVIYTNPPQINIAIIHDDNGDSCEAYITEVLRFKLDSLIGTAVGGEVTIGGYSSWDTSDTSVYVGNKYDFSFAESDYCTLTVTAKVAMCGWGLYGSTWFALEDSISAGMEGYYYNKFLQPVSINESIRGFVPVAGKKYLIGARIDNEKYNFSDIVICLAYPGPSIPVKIMCISEIK